MLLATTAIALLLGLCPVATICGDQGNGGCGKHAALKTMTAQFPFKRTTNGVEM